MCPPAWDTHSSGPKFRFLVQKSDFCHTTPILVDDPILALGMTVNFPPWERFYDFPFRRYSCFCKKIHCVSYDTITIDLLENDFIFYFWWSKFFYPPKLFFSHSLIVAKSSYQLHKNVINGCGQLIIHAFPGPFLPRSAKLWNIYAGFGWHNQYDCTS